MARVQDILSWLDAYAPFRYSAAWDNSGLNVGAPEAQVTGLLVALDVTMETLAEALARRCNCMVVHHPLIFEPLRAVRTDQFPGVLVTKALVEGIHVIAAHTNLDVAHKGTNDVLAAALGVAHVDLLDDEERWRGEPLYGGLGRVGVLDPPRALGEWLRQLQELWPDGRVRAVGSPMHLIRRVALCSGSGGSLLGKAIAAGCDAYVTGDLKYHEARHAEAAGLALIDIGHFTSEKLIVEPLAAYLRDRAAAAKTHLPVAVAQKERDPFTSAWR
jgi:dinuclear metal center YbgI/SA1388 family protein